ncbi:MAG: ATP-binding cassette domain-containing protein [Lachnospiraceae bacterium]|nr:ATP-binding cassette domain-containing protein [Lachnospiraceae bacterium]
MRIRGLRKNYQVSGRCLEVLKGLDLDLADEGITVVLGRSGCGKTTLLRLIAGLETADWGEIAGGEMTDPGKIGVIFQEPRLMPWLTVEKNILFGVKKKRQDREALSYLLALTGLIGFEKARPFQLSGGMQQRVALARALAYEPDFLLMDEPFAALDYFTRTQMQQELLRIHQKENKGILFVTHSIEEALTLGTKIVILENGICGKSYDLGDVAFPRDLLSEEMLSRKRELILRIEEYCQ